MDNWEFLESDTSLCKTYVYIIQNRETILFNKYSRYTVKMTAILHKKENENCTHNLHQILCCILSCVFLLPGKSLAIVIIMRMVCMTSM